MQFLTIGVIFDNPNMILSPGAYLSLNNNPAVPGLYDLILWGWGSRSESGINNEKSVVITFL